MPVLCRFPVLPLILGGARGGLLLALFTLLTPLATAGAIPLPSGRSLELLENEEAKTAIIEEQHDPFFRLLTPLDVELRLAEPLPNVSREQRDQLIKKQFRDAVTRWPETEMAGLTSACRQLEGEIDRVCPSFIPGKWKFIRTDGTEEAGAAYTRHDVIVLPATKLAMSGGPGQDYSLARLIAHETAHVFSRLNPKTREKLYARLGFRPVGSIELGDWLAPRRITNPDGPLFDHVIRLQHPQMGEVEGTLVTYSPHERFSPQFGRTLFRYLKSGIALVESQEKGYRVRTGPTGEAMIVQPAEVGGFYEQIGRNTNYIIHPDEILADNLAILFTRNWPNHAPGQIADEKLLNDLAEILRTANDNRSAQPIHQ